MASSPKFVCLFFLLTTLVFSLQTNARDSQFFSKVTRNRDEAPTTTPNTNKLFMNNKENEFEPLNKQQEQEEQPTFIPQTTETGYGLYGHETGLNPPATTATTTSLYNMHENNNNNNNKNNKFEDFNSYFKNNNEDHDKNYAPELKGLSSTTYSTNVAPTKYINNFDNNNNYNNEKNGKYYYNNEKNGEYYYNNEKNGKYYYNGGAKYNDVQEKQGMSDTRFLENGKYYYGVNSEKNYEPNNNYMSHSNNYNNNYETNGYYGNNKANRFDAYYDAYYRNNNKNNNNNNNFFSGNGMQGYKNQVPQEEEFEFDDQP